MEKYWELEPTKVQVFVKDQNHLDELFKMCISFGVEINISFYKSEYKYFRKNNTDSWYANYRYNEDYTEVNTEQFYEILCHHYGYQGELKGFDKEVVLKMLKYQEEQVKKRDIKVFEKNPELSDTAAGFDWDKTIEGGDFWDETIFDNKGKFPEQQPATSKDLETETQSKEVEMLKEENESLKLKNSELESEQIRLRNINKIMSEELTSIENSYRKLEKENKKLKKLVRHFIKK